MFGLPKEVRAAQTTLAPGAKLNVQITLQFESSDVHLNEEAPNRFQVKAPASFVSQVRS